MTPSTPQTIAQAIRFATSAGLDKLDAQLLLLHVLGLPAHDRAWLLAHDLDGLEAATQARYQALVPRRAAGEPLAYLTGTKAFYGLDLQVSPAVLVPRPDTETLVDWALGLHLNPDPLHGPAKVLDLGTGSGAIALALKHQRPQWQVSATDASEAALSVARSNAQRLGLNVDFHLGFWYRAVNDNAIKNEANYAASTGTKPLFDLIVSNPPYICAHDAHLAALTHEPLQALASGADGLDDIRHIVAQAPAHLRPGGWLLLEHGYDQAVRVRDLMRQAGFANVQSKLDLNGIERCSGGQMDSQA